MQRCLVALGELHRSLPHDVPVNVRVLLSDPSKVSVDGPDPDAKQRRCLSIRSPFIISQQCQNNTPLPWGELAYPIAKRHVRTVFIGGRKYHGHRFDLSHETPLPFRR